MSIGDESDNSHNEDVHLKEEDQITIHPRHLIDCALATLGQATLFTGIALLVRASVLAAVEVGASDMLAVLPASFEVLFRSISAIIGSRVAKHVSRRASLVLGACFGVIGSLVAFIGLLLVNRSFGLLVVGNALVGLQNGIGQSFRFVAAESVPQKYRSLALSLTVAGGAISAATGPFAAEGTKGWITSSPYAGSFLTLVIICSFLLLICASISGPLLPSRERSGHADNSQQPVETASDPHQDAKAVAIDSDSALAVAEQGNQVQLCLEAESSHRGVMQLMLGSRATPNARVGVLSCVMAWAHMVPTMFTAGREIAQYHGANTATGIIAAHLASMFLPGLTTGQLIAFLGSKSVVLLGVLLSVAGSVIASIAPTALFAFVITLVCSGIGWSFMYIGGSSLIVASSGDKDEEMLTANEAKQLQGATEATSFIASAITTVMSGPLIESASWRGFALVLLFPMLLPAGLMLAACN